VSTPIPAQPAQEPLFEVDVELLERLMKRTKTGAPIKGRELTTKAGIAHSTISNLLNGVRENVYGSTAAAICDVIGVELLVLCTPVERLEPAVARPGELAAV
jgi:DNA-binding Xre family transcriptional regulator